MTRATREMALCIILPLAALAHKPMVHGVTCGTQFASASTAATVPSIAGLWGISRTVTCEGPVFWVTFETTKRTSSQSSLFEGRGIGYVAELYASGWSAVGCIDAERSDQRLILRPSAVTRGSF